MGEKMIVLTLLILAIAVGVYFMARKKAGGGCCAEHDDSSNTDADVPVAKDPVCDMDVKVTEKALRSSYNGKPYYFCSNYCVERFEREPRLWVGSGEIEE